MRRNARYLAGVVVLMLSAAAALAWVLSQDAERFRPQLAALLSEAVGVPVALDGPMRWFWQPSLVLEASQVSLQAPSLNVRIDRLEVRAGTLGLLQGDLRLRRLSATGVTVDLGSEHGVAAALPDPARLPLDHLEVQDLRLLRNGQPWLAIERIAFDGTAGGVAIPFQMTVDDALSAHARVEVEGEGGSVRLHDLLLRTPAGEMRGTLDVKLAIRPPMVSAKLRAERLTIAPPRKARPGEPLIPRLALNLSAAQWFDAEIDFAADTIAIGELQLQEVLLPVSLQQSHLQLTATARLGAGSVTVESNVRADEQRWASRVNLADANAGALLTLLGMDDARDGGVVNLQAELDADGAHTDALLRSLRGDVSLRVSGLSIDAGALQLAGVDLPVKLIQVMRGAGRQPIELRCAVADFEVSGGVLRARDTMGAQTAGSNLLGGGVIALPQERMDLIVRAWPREGLALSLSTLSGAVSVSGPLLRPRVALTDEAVWRTGAAVLTGGASLIAQGLLERARGDTPCEQAMGRLKLDRGRGDVAKSVNEITDSAVRAITESSASAAKSVSSGADRVAETVRKGARGIGQRLQGLFGGNGGRPKQRRPEIN